jgi:hypothetical protein
VDDQKRIDTDPPGGAPAPGPCAVGIGVGERARAAESAVSPVAVPPASFASLWRGAAGGAIACAGGCL